MKNESVMIVKHIGTYEFGNTVDVTDPCLERDNVNRFKDIHIVPGVYYCDAVYEGDRIQEINIKLKSVIDQFVGEFLMDDIGAVGVFSGVAGFFNSTTEYSEEEWHCFCDTIKENRAWITENGFCAAQEIMEKGFRVYAHKNENEEIDALSIEFFLPDFTE